jgi:hypothetical protein
LSAPQAEILNAVIPLIKAGVPALGQRVHGYHVPASVQEPYATVEAVAATDESAACIDALDVTLVIIVWSASKGAMAAIAAAEAIRRLLHETPPALGPDWTCLGCLHRDTRTQPDGDGLRHLVMMDFSLNLDRI